jgi:hypothetical protein
MFFRLVKLTILIFLTVILTRQKNKSNKEKDKDKNKDNVTNTDNNVIQASFADFKAFARQQPSNNNNLLNNLLNTLKTCEINYTYD